MTIEHDSPDRSVPVLGRVVATERRPNTPHENDPATTTKETYHAGALV